MRVEDREGKVKDKKWFGCKIGSSEGRQSRSSRSKRKER
jgi:hypothetical protein